MLEKLKEGNYSLDLVARNSDGIIKEKRHIVVKNNVVVKEEILGGVLE